MLPDIKELYTCIKHLLIEKPFYGLLLCKLNKEFSTVIPTACIEFNNDGKITLIVNPNFWVKLNLNQKKWLLEHEVLHIVYFHGILFKEFNNLMLFNEAADMEINQYLNYDHKIEGCVDVNDFPDFPLKAGTRAYYTLLKKEKKDNLREWYHTWKSDMSDSIIQNQIEQLIEKAYNEANEKGCGNIPLKVQEIIKLIEARRSQINWKKVIKSYGHSKQSVNIKATRHRESKRFVGLPGLKRNRVRSILVAIDTSGSVSKQELEYFLIEINNLIKANVNITILQCDANITSIKEIKKSALTEFVISGRGGTSFQPALDFYNENLKIYNGLIYFTDGFATIPTSVNKNILWVFSSNINNVEGFPGKHVKIKING